MITILGGMAGGLGLFFMGSRLLSEHIMLLTNRRVRLSAARWTGSRGAAFAWGALAGAVTQTMPALTFLTVSMLRSGLLSIRRAFALLLGGNVGVALLLLVVMFDIELAVFYVLGVSGVVALVTTEGGRARWQAIAAAVFAMAMMVLGFLVLRESVAPLAEQPWFRDAVARAAGSMLLCLVGAAALSLLVQSTSVVVVTGIGMVLAGVLEIEQALMLCYGACLGSSVSVYLLTLNLTGRARQVAAYQVLFNCVSAAIFVPLLLVETHFGTPGVATAIRSVDLPLAPALALTCIVVELTTGLVQLATLGPASRLIARWWPATEAETLSRLRYARDAAFGDVGTGLLLVDLEQRRVPEILSRMLDRARRGIEPGGLRHAAKDVLARVGEFLDDLGSERPTRGVDQHVSLLTRQRLYAWLDEQMLKFLDDTGAMPRTSALAAWRDGLIEAIDSALLILSEVAATDGPPVPAAVLGERGGLMRSIRDAHLGAGSSLSTAERAGVLRITSTTEHIFLLLARLASDYEQFPGDRARLNNIESQRTVAVAAGGAIPVEA